MLRTVSVCFAAALGSVVLIGADGLLAQSDPAAIVKEREDLMKQMGRSFGPLIAVIKGETTDLVAAAEAAHTMNDSAMQLVDLFPEGTAAGEIDGTRAKPEIWTQRDEFDAALQALIDTSGQLAATAEAGDLEAFKAQFQDVAMACGGCHESKGSDGGKFRLPAE